MLIDDLLKEVMNYGASDLHVSAGMPPIIRVDGSLLRTKYEAFNPKTIEELLFPMLNNEQRRILEQNWELDMSYGLSGVGRFRVNLYKNRGTYAGAFRVINTNIPSFDTLGLSDIVKSVTMRSRGLVLVTGPTGSGKSTTLASMIDYINDTRNEHILTIEDPIEFVHKSKKCVIHQRELGQDTRSFANALKSALREDPDIILVGALTAAETGHLVFGTLHTSSASQTIDRIIDVFPEGQQQQIRVQLGNTLEAVFSQTLLPRLQANGIKKGRVMAQEIMIKNNAISNLIREGKSAQIYSAIQTGMGQGMQTLETALSDLYKQGLVKMEDAIAKSQRPDEFRRLAGIQ